MSVHVPRHPTMKAIVCHKYGPPGVLELRDVDTPALTDDGVLVRVRVARSGPTCHGRSPSSPVVRA